MIIPNVYYISAEYMPTDAGETDEHRNSVYIDLPHIGTPDSGAGSLTNSVCSIRSQSNSYTPEHNAHIYNNSNNNTDNTHSTSTKPSLDNSFNSRQGMVERTVAKQRTDLYRSTKQINDLQAQVPTFHYIASSYKFYKYFVCTILSTLWQIICCGFSIILYSYSILIVIYIGWLLLLIYIDLYYCWLIFEFQSRLVSRRREKTTIADFYAPPPDRPSPGITVLGNVAGKIYCIVLISQRLAMAQVKITS